MTAHTVSGTGSAASESVHVTASGGPSTLALTAGTMSITVIPVDGEPTVDLYTITGGMPAGDWDGVYVTDSDGTDHPASATYRAGRWCGDGSDWQEDDEHAPKADLSQPWTLPGVVQNGAVRSLLMAEADARWLGNLTPKLRATPARPTHGETVEFVVPVVQPGFGVLKAAASGGRYTTTIESINASTGLNGSYQDRHSGLATTNRIVVLRSTANTRTPTAVVIDDETDKLRLPLAAGATTHLFQTAARPEAVFTGPAATTASRWSTRTARANGRTPRLPRASTPMSSRRGGSNRAA